MFYRPRLGMEAIIGTPAERSAVMRLGVRAGVKSVSAWGLVVAWAFAVAGPETLSAHTGPTT